MMESIKTQQDAFNERIYRETIRYNYRELQSIDKDKFKKLSLVLFFMYFTSKYRALMSELSHE